MAAPRGAAVYDMNSSATTRFATALIVIAGVVFFGTLVRALWYAPDAQVPAPDLAAEAPGKDVPATHFPERLLIPRLHIDAAVQYVGVNAKGDMATPSNFTDVAWYKYGAVPGQLGSAVIAGHVDNGLKLDGVFKRLGDLKVGDDVYVQRRDGARLHFVVTEIKSYPYKSVPTDRLFERADRTRLNLVTCEGGWVGAEKTYDHRLIVYTVYTETIPFRP